MTDCIFATYSALPDGDPHDRLVAAALQELGISVRFGVWNDPEVDWTDARLCVVRSTWDYPKDYRGFFAWLDRVARTTDMRNDAATVRWNAHKFYLRDLETAGVPVLPTAWLAARTAVDLPELMTARGWHDAIVKPSYGASSYNVMRVASLEDAAAGGQRHLDELLDSQDVLVQPFLRSLERYPERALIFIGGRYSHAVQKTPFQTSLPNGEAGDAPLVAATPEEIAVARRAVDAAPTSPLYARVDLVRNDAGAICVMELELIEPTLFLAMHPPSVRAFADAIAAELE